MRCNENIAISAPQVLLVPYEAHHVPRYHSWMKDPEIQELTASEPLSVEEEYENQCSWRTSADKLTFILCLPRAVPEGGDEATGRAVVGKDDAVERMVGDINLFLYPEDDCDDCDEGQDGGSSRMNGRGVREVYGEVDIMIAEKTARGNGLGKASLAAFLSFIQRHLDDILTEYACGCCPELAPADGCAGVRLARLVARIGEGNAKSRGLFKRMGFVQEKGPNYFGEVEMVMRRFAEWKQEVECQDCELLYKRE